VKPTPERAAARLARVRAHMIGEGLDGLAVTHLPNVQYLTGLVASAGAAIVLRDACLLVVDFRYVTAATALAASLDGVVRVETFGHSYEEAIVDLLHAAGARRIGIEAVHLPVARYNAIASGLAARTPEATVPALVPTERLVERARMIKDEAEVAALREAGRRLSGVATRVPAFVSAGRTERDIAEEIELELRRAGFTRPAFETIVASGPNSALPHARPTDRAVQVGDPTVLDFGGVYDGYCVDLTRTVQLGGLSGPMAKLYAAVAEAQEAAIAAVRPGVASSAVDAAARSVLERHGLGEAFGHATGHGLGLEVHEEPRIAKPSARLPDVALEAGMVFTIEPGAYVPGVGGVRIEDDVLVILDGCEVLTR